MKRAYFPLLFPALLLLGYLLLWPVDLRPEAWVPPEAPSMSGPYEVNNALARVERLGEHVAAAPEDIAVDAEGRIYGGNVDGRILRWSPDLSHVEEFADTRGRPLGMHFDAAGNLVVADAMQGLLSINPAGAIEILTTEEGGRPFRLTDDVDIGADGTIYFSDASDRFGVEDFTADLLEHRPNGRLLAYDPRSGQTHLLLDKLYFANGVAVSPDQQYLLVVETGKYRVQRYWLSGEKAGSAEIFAENLPGFPDGISTGSEGVYWVAIASPRDATLDQVLPHPLLRKIIYRLPKRLQPMPARYSFVLGLNGDGEVAFNLQDPGGRYAPITSVQEHQGILWFGSIREQAFARMPRPVAAGSAA